MGTKSEIPPGTLYMLILRSLARLGPMHGYGVAQFIQQTSDDVLQVEEGSLYPALHRMEEKEWVVGEWGISANKRRAKFYRLTARGRTQLARETQDWWRYVDAVAQVLRATARPVTA